MDELRQPHNLHLPSQHSSGRRNARPEGRPSRLGQTLRDAREEKGLELRDLSVLTNIRVMHLEALEQGDFQNLPEDPYSKNFVRLYAQAVGLEPSRTLLLYSQERRAASGASSGRAPKRTLELPPEAARPFFENPRLVRALGLLATLLLVALLVLLGLWGFNRMMSRGTSTAPVTASGAVTPRVPPAEAAPSEPAQSAAAQVPLPSAATPGMVLLSVRTTPPGAEISVDGYPFGQSPIVDAPIRAGQRTVEITRAGYQPFSSTLELTGNRRLNFELNPTNGTVTTPAGAANQLTVTVSEEAWLEVYEGAARGEGERLVYETAKPGDTFVFSAPVYIFSGNARGVSISRGEQTSALGTGVTGQAYGGE